MRSGIGAVDTLRLNLSGEYDPERGVLYITGTSIVESLGGATRPANALVRLFWNVHERMIPDALVDHVDLCGPGLGFYQVNTVSNRDGDFAIPIPIAPEHLEDILSCLSIAATTSKGWDAVGAVAYGIAQ